MKPRSITVEKGGAVRVPLSRFGEAECIISFDDYQELLDLGVYPNWQLRGGNVASRGPGGISVLIARVLTDAKAGERVLYKDGDRKNLRRVNLSVVQNGFSVNHDRAKLLPVPA